MVRLGKLLDVFCNDVFLDNFAALKMLFTLLKWEHFCPTLHDQLVTFPNNGVYTTSVLQMPSEFWAT